MWLHLAKVFEDGLGVLDEIDHRASHDRNVLADHALGNVAQGQESNSLATLRQALEEAARLASQHRTQIGMGDHCALGPAGGARGVDKNGDISRFAGFAARLDQTSVGLQIVSADVAQLLQRDDLWIVELAQAFHVEDHHLADSWQFVAHIEEFVELLVTLDEQIDRG